MHRREAAGHRVGERAVQQEEVGGDADAEQRDGRRHAHQRQLGALVAGVRRRRPRAVRGRRRGRGVAPSARRAGTPAGAPCAPPPRRRDGSRLEERLDPVLAAERVRHADVAGEHRAERQDDQRDRHRRRRVVQVRRRGRDRRGRAPCPPCPCASCPWPAARALAVERQEDQAEHVDRGQQRRQPRRSTHSTRWPLANVLEEDLVLAEEAGQERHAGDGQRADQERPVGDRQLLACRPPILRMSCSPCSAWITAPEPRNISALKKACV